MESLYADSSLIYVGIWCLRVLANDSPRNIKVNKKIVVNSTAILVNNASYFLVAAYIWGSFLRDPYVTLHSDNETVVHILNKQSSKDSSIIETHSWQIKCFTRSPSRFHVDEFKKLTPCMDATPTVVPSDLLKVQRFKS
ncbi:hypothetical protein KUTeg_017413 [Tegillarca granosa]|uniref:Uncharacterized protein n=1 Tax=Tegillarca granosa TaxID=220873 RepID=A0ABQ9EID8_TEGGR|nr:hypothetical protein KUTeg_017413 [Tegillarca granosa]